MADLLIDTHVPGLTGGGAEAAARAEALDFDAVYTSETEEDAMLPLPLVADRTDSVDLGTRVTLAFTRSPMVLAYQGWAIQRFSEGRFVLGLGTQVKGHNERRFSVDWTSPGPRLREVVESIRHVWDVWQGGAERLDYEGEHYSFSLMTETFDPGPVDHPDVPIYIAAVNEYNVRMAGEVCDGLHMHSFNTPGYTEDVIGPLVAESAEGADRAREAVSLSASPFVVTGGTEEERDDQREEVRRRIAFYGSTRTYHDVLGHHGWKTVGEELHELSTERAWDEMADLVTDEMVATFAIEADPDELRHEAVDVYGDVADRVALPLEHGEAFMD